MIKRIPKHTASPLPWKVETRYTSGAKTLVCRIVDANGDAVVNETRDEDGATLSSTKR